jgi:hypothetical protein
MAKLNFMIPPGEDTDCHPMVGQFPVALKLNILYN